LYFLIDKKDNTIVQEGQYPDIFAKIVK